MASSEGNIWMQRVEHSYTAGRCSECGASEAQMERENRENYAYAFIHRSGQEAVREDSSMRFDVVIGNPPHQMEADGGSRTVPLYNLFIEQAKELNPRFISMIVPSRWMAGGLGLNEFRNTMMSDRRITRLVDYARMDSLFPGVDFEGGSAISFGTATASGCTNGRRRLRMSRWSASGTCSREVLRRTDQVFGFGNMDNWGTRAARSTPCLQGVTGSTSRHRPR